MRKVFLKTETKNIEVAMKNSVFMKVSNDEYELPEIVADTAKELAEKCGVSENTIYGCVSRARTGKVYRSSYVKVTLNKED